MLSLRAKPQPKPPSYRARAEVRSDPRDPMAGLQRRRRAFRSVWTPSLLRRLLRHRGVRTVVALTAVALAASSVSAERDALRAQRAAWDSTVVAVEVVRFVPAGGDVGGAVRLVERPAAVVPDGALTGLPSRGLAAVDLVPGELVLAQRVRQAGEGLLPAGTVAITVELDGKAALVERNALVDVWVTDAANFSSRRIVRSALVLRLDDRDLTIAIPEGAAGEVAVASLRPLTVTVVR